MNIGILYSRSNAHPNLMMDFLDGMKAAISHLQLNNDIRLTFESAGFGGNEKEVLEKVEKLLVVDGADVVVAYIDLLVLEAVKPLLHASGKVILIVNPGANYPLNRESPSNILNLNLQHGLLSWLTGKLASSMKKKCAVMVTTFYDCGYLHNAAMVNGFESTGGEIIYHYINNQRYDHDFEISQLTGFLSSDNRADCLLCLFDSLPASMLYSLLLKDYHADDLSLFVSPMMLEKQSVEKIPCRPGLSIHGYIPWHVSIDNKANRTFMDSYSRQTKKEAGIFSLLGWETGLVLQKIVLYSQQGYADGTAIICDLSKGKIDSPRGEIKLDAATNYFISPVYKCEVNQNSAELVVKLQELEYKEWENFLNISKQSVSSGWKNTYLCY